MTGKRWIALGVAVALLFLYGVGQFASVGLLAQESGEFREEVIQTGSIDKIVMLEVEGVIVDQSSMSPFDQGDYHHKSFLSQLEHAFEDESVKGIILRVNSPGGGLVESDEIYHKIRDLKKEYPDKKIVTYMANMAASGGYYIAAPTDKIYANRSTITGSIGVIMGNLDLSELAQDWGIKRNTFKSGPHKDILSPLRETTDEERQIIQTMVDEMYEQFVDVVDEGRPNLNRNEIISLADGRIYTGNQALKAGLIDEIGFFDDAVAGVAEMAGIEDPTVVRYKRSGMSFINEYFDVIGDVRSLVGYRDLEGVLQRQYQPSFMYLFTW